MLTEKQQQLILDHLSTHDLKNKLSKLDSAYFLADDRHERQKILLFIDEIKIELIKRGKHGRTCKQDRSMAS